MLIMLHHPEGRPLCGMFQNRKQRKNCGSKREKMILKLIKLHNGKQNNFVFLTRYYYSKKIRRY